MNNRTTTISWNMTSYDILAAVNNTIYLSSTRDLSIPPHSPFTLSGFSVLTGNLDGMPNIYILATLFQGINGYYTQLGGDHALARIEILAESIRVSAMLQPSPDISDETQSLNILAEKFVDELTSELQAAATSAEKNLRPTVTDKIKRRADLFKAIKDADPYHLSYNAVASKATRQVFEQVYAELAKSHPDKPTPFLKLEANERLKRDYGKADFTGQDVNNAYDAMKKAGYGSFEWIKSL